MEDKNLRNTSALESTYFLLGSTSGTIGILFVMIGFFSGSLWFFTFGALLSLFGGVLIYRGYYFNEKSEVQPLKKSKTYINCPYCKGEILELQHYKLKAGEDVKCEFCGKIIES